MQARLCLLGALTVLALGGSLAYGSIPDQQGTVHGCYQNLGGQLRVIDTGKGASCTQFESSLNWNQRSRCGP